MTKTHKQFIKEIQHKNDKIIIIGNYTGTTNYIKAKCKRCGYEWEAKAYSLLSGRACPKCRTIRGMENNKGLTAKKSHNDFVSELKKLIMILSLNQVTITTKALLSVDVIDVIIIGKQEHIHYYKDMVALDVPNLELVLWNNL